MISLDQLFFLWLGCAGLLLAGAPARYLNPFQWPGKVWLVILFAPLSVLWWLAQDLLWAYRIRTSAKPPRPARFEVPGEQWSARLRGGHGDRYEDIEGRVYEVVGVTVTRSGWGARAALVGAPWEECRITMWDVHEGRYKRHIPAPLAALVDRAGGGL